MTSTPISGASQRDVSLPEQPQDGLNLTAFARDNISRRAAATSPPAGFSEDGGGEDGSVISTSTIDNPADGGTTQTVPAGVTALSYAQLADDPTTEPDQTVGGEGETIGTTSLETDGALSVSRDVDTLGTLSYVDFPDY